MTIEKASEEDVPELEKMISTEFPYKMLTRESISERMKRPGITVFKMTLGRRIVGFVEVEDMEAAARINAIGVLPSERRKGHAKELLSFALDYARGHGALKATLLVKKGNVRAKGVYSAAGFGFVHVHEKMIEGSEVEVWEKDLAVAGEGYLN